MGAWGAKIFENDGALDQLADLTKNEQSPLESIVQGLMEVLSSEYVDSYEGEGILVLAVFVIGFKSRSYLKEQRGKNVPEYLYEPINRFLDKYQSSWDKDIRTKTYTTKLLTVEQLTLSTIAVVNSEKSELYELWGESDMAEWQETLDTLTNELMNLTAI
ncbi:predicted protein [Scheffersomyces stipitis CBS 6054]|uniref:DUF4259 domain-containing protein n=1 Tax=Scheffersomyces stipitis (strain ATCC 58785 / CBS 6054 / NBRC 10063 / NRRL Y-11545) TaxID=322104 RepID=A3LRL0_PICST|nr:predicted protein [Scheffersomyces stipitis CBS 6054]ABN65401.1 predicted protein [Scheffersomyces stipitis CBS 6054]KAG2733625.1 hypothetical protein G9P44_003150 [Scheffersomyces stipitis]